MNFIILPHADDPEAQEGLMLTRTEWESKSYKVISLTDHQGLVVDGNRIETV